MIQFIQHNAINKEKWDQLVTRASNFSPLVLSPSLDVLHPNWSALVAGDYEAAMPLCTASKWGMHYIHQPPFVQQLGIYYKSDIAAATNEITPSHSIVEFLAAIPQKFKLADLMLDANTAADFGAHIQPTFSTKIKGKLSVQQRSTCDLQANGLNFQKNYSENAKRNFKKAQKSDLTIDNNAPLHEVIAFFKKGKGNNLATVTSAHYERLQQLHNAFKANPINPVWALKTSCWGVRGNDGQLQAGALFVASPVAHYFLFSGLHPSGRATGAMSYLIDAYLQDQLKEGQVFHFNGSQEPHLERFYKGFGAQTQLYYHLRLNRLPILFKWMGIKS